MIQRLEISNDELLDFEQKHYQGPVIVINTVQELEIHFENLSKEDKIGFDTETRPAFKKGQYYDVALIQIATSQCVYLIRVNKIGFHPLLRSLFEDEQILKIGIGILDDLRALNKMNEFKPASFVDLNDYCQELGYVSIGAKKLSALVLGFRISKKQQTSNWENNVLTDAQIRYAATDAWICLEIYNKLNAN